MRRIILALVLAAPVMLGQTAERQFQSSTSISTLTPPSSSTPENIAHAYMTTHAALIGDAWSSVYLAKEYTTEHNGVTHMVYRQRFQGIDVYNSAWVANVGPDGALLSAGGSLFPAPGAINFANRISTDKAARAAVHEVNATLADNVAPVAVSSLKDAGGKARFTIDGVDEEIQGKLVWYAHRSVLLLAWVFNVVDEDGVSAYDVAVEAETGAIIDKKTTTFFQAPKGFVFDKGYPQPNPTPGVRITTAPPIVERTLVTLSGDPVASPFGWIQNSETAGYNAIVGENLLGQGFLLNAPRTRATGDFTFPLLVGPTAPNPLNYSDAANTNLFYWVNRVHDLFYGIGFTETAGNFQADNYGRGGLGGDAIMAYSHYASAAQFSPALTNAFFSSRSIDDGGLSMIAMYTATGGAGTFFTDGAYAADVITHEYTHGVSLRLIPDGYATFQTAAMGEAWSDFFALEFTTPAGGPVDGSYPTGEYFIQAWGTGIRTRPYSTNTAVNPLTFANVGRVVPYPEVHADGEIWANTLWELRGALIQQLGETEGRRRIRRLVLDGLTLSPPSPSMVDARDAILLADRVDFKGESQDQLWAAFAKRGLGALAHSDGGDTIHVIPSFEAPSARAKIKFYEDTFIVGELVRVLLSDANQSQPTVRVQITASSGDQEDLVLTRVGSIYVGAIFSSNAAVVRQNGVINFIPGDTVTASYMDTSAGLFGPFSRTSLIETTAATQQAHVLSISTTVTGIPTFANETRITNVRSPVTTAIPFDFPFFSKKYRSMVVFPTGVIEFEPSIETSLLGPGCNDATELAHITGIAPLFSQLTFGSAQPNEGIYVSSPSPTSMSIRWAAEILQGSALFGAITPEPVNVAALITADGTITFYYGSGNNNLGSAAQTFSSCGPQPTIGISPGHDVYARTFTLRSYTDQNPITFLPNFGATSAPEVFVERPAAGETVRGVVRISGIAFEPSPSNLNLLLRRDVYVDDIERTTALTVSRPDYCATRNVPGCPNVGFQADLNLTALNLAPGPHTIKVRASNSRGGFTDSAPVAVIVDTTPTRLPKGAIESPVAGAELSGTAVTVRGYAYADDLRVTRVDLLIDGVTNPGSTGSGATYGVARTDICGPLPAPLPPNCVPNAGVGWTLTLNTRTGPVPLTDGAHSMQLRVLDETGRFTLIPSNPVPFTVKNGPSAALPIGAITSTKPGDTLSGIAQISGYAYSPGGRIIGALLLIDGQSKASAQYGLPRPQECATLTNVPACPNIGFNIVFDTRAVSNGEHVLGVLLFNDVGGSLLIPDLVRNGMNVRISNP